MDEPHVYEIKVGARLDKQWSSWFNGMTLVSDQGKSGWPVTVMTGIVADQAALHGILAKIRDLGLTLLSVTRVE